MYFVCVCVCVCVYLAVGEGWGWGVGMSLALDIQLPMYLVAHETVFVHSFLPLSRYWGHGLGCLPVPEFEYLCVHNSFSL
jgi:hypothetical protein